MTGDITLAQFLEYVRNISVTSTLVFIFYGGYRKWWVWGHQLITMETMYQSQIADLKAMSKSYETGYLRLLGLQEQQVAVLEKKMVVGQ